MDHFYLPPTSHLGEIDFRAGVAFLLGRDGKEQNLGNPKDLLNFFQMLHKNWLAVGPEIPKALLRLSKTDRATLWAQLVFDKRLSDKFMEAFLCATPQRLSDVEISLTHQNETLRGLCFISFCEPF